MPVNDTRDNRSAAVSEATRLVAETSRRTVDNSKAAVEAARSLLDDQAEVSTKLFQAWAANTEGALKASFEVQNASLTALSPILDAAITSQRTALKQWDTALRQGQQALLDAFRAQVRASSRLGQLGTPDR